MKSLRFSSVNIELCAGCIFSSKSDGKEVESSIVGHIKRCENYANYLQEQGDACEPWVVHFFASESVTAKQIKEFEPHWQERSEVNVLYIFHDKKFDFVCIKYLLKKKKEEESVFRIVLDKKE